MRCIGPIALAEVVDRFDSAHDFVVAGLVVMVVSCVWGSFTEWRDEFFGNQANKAVETQSQPATADPHSRSWTSVKAEK